MSDHAIATFKYFTESALGHWRRTFSFFTHQKKTMQDEIATLRGTIVSLAESLSSCFPKTFFEFNLDKLNVDTNAEAMRRFTRQSDFATYLSSMFYFTKQEEEDKFNAEMDELFNGKFIHVNDIFGERNNLYFVYNVLGIDSSCFVLQDEAKKNKTTIYTTPGNDCVFIFSIFNEAEGVYINVKDHLLESDVPAFKKFFEDKLKQRTPAITTNYNESFTALFDIIQKNKFCDLIQQSIPEGFVSNDFSEKETNFDSVTYDLVASISVPLLSLKYYKFVGHESKENLIVISHGQIKFYFNNVFHLVMFANNAVTKENVELQKLDTIVNFVYEIIDVLKNKKGKLNWF